MSKVFEALQKAEKEQAAGATTVDKSPPSRGPREELDVRLGELESLPKLSTAPLERQRGRGTISPSLVVHWESDSPAVEQIKRLRTYILHHQTDSTPPPRSILVTSATADEGKSFVAANLAVSIAQLPDHSAVLVDGDLRSPVLHRLFGHRRVPGLSDYLAGEAEIDEILKATLFDRLGLITAGTKRDHPVELVSSGRLRDLLQALRVDENRLVIFDSTPVVLTNEPGILAKELDGTLLVVCHNQTPRTMVKEALTVLGQDRLLGMIFNMVEPGSFGYYSRAYKRYYGRNVEGEKRRKRKK